MLNPVQATIPSVVPTTSPVPSPIVKPINVMDYGAKGDGSTDDTAAIQRAIDFASNGSDGTIIVPDGTFLINADTSIKMKSNTHLRLSNNATLKAKANKNQNYGVITINGVHNASVAGGKIIGDRLIHTGTSGEWGMGIKILGSSNIYIATIAISNCWGDGIYVSQGSGILYSQYVTIENVKLDNNRRQGISVISAKDLIIKDSTASNTNGTAPQYGLDLEPNSTIEFLQNILIDNFHTENNAGFGIGINLREKYNIVPKSNVNNIIIKGYTNSGNTRGITPRVVDVYMNKYEYDIKILP